MTDNKEIREIVKTRYGQIAKSSSAGNDCGCQPSLDTSCCNTESIGLEELSRMLGYTEDDLRNVPDLSNLGLGCGNPQAIANIRMGETVLDLGSGAGFDAFLASKQVGKNGRVIGVDMTSEMIAKARENAERGNYENVEFRQGEIEQLPLEENCVDVIISNCVINLSPEKEKVFKEAYRVLKKGGRLAVSDIVTKVKFPKIFKDNMELYSACITGASTVDDLKSKLKETGFINIRINPKQEIDSVIKSWAPGTRISEYIFSASIEAIKPE